MRCGMSRRPDVHNALANKIRQLLTPLLRPRYTARLGIYVVEDTAPEGDIGIMYPDVEVMLAGRASANSRGRGTLPPADAARRPSHLFPLYYRGRKATKPWARASLLAEAPVPASRW